MLLALAALTVLFHKGSTIRTSVLVEFEFHANGVG
jgi:hypothetical protein